VWSWEVYRCNRFNKTADLPECLDVLMTLTIYFFEFWFLFGAS